MQMVVHKPFAVSLPRKNAPLVPMEQQGIVRNQFSAEEDRNRNQKTGNQFCTKVSVIKAGHAGGVHDN